MEAVLSISGLFSVFYLAGVKHHAGDVLSSLPTIGADDSLLKADLHVLTTRKAQPKSNNIETEAKLWYGIF